MNIDLLKYDNEYISLKTKKGNIITGYALVYDDDGYYIEIEQPSEIRRFYCEDIESIDYVMPKMKKSTALYDGKLSD